MYKVGMWRTLSAPIYYPEAFIGFPAALEELIDRLKSDALEQGLSLKIRASSEGVVPQSYAGTVLRVIDELLCNAIEHGFYKCRRGQILLEIGSCTEKIYIVAHDDGWGFGRAKTVDGNGFLLLKQIGDVKVSHGEHPFKACVGVVLPLVLRTPNGAGRWPQPPPDEDGPPIPRSSRPRLDQDPEGGSIAPGLHRLSSWMSSWWRAPARHLSLVGLGQVHIGGGAG
jgi:hypothetical protein